MKAITVCVEYDDLLAKHNIDIDDIPDDNTEYDLLTCPGDFADYFGDDEEEKRSDQ